MPPTLDKNKPLSVIVFGATGDLAKKKLFPALYQLVLLDHFPRNVNIVGYGRSAVVLEEFYAKQCVNVVENAKLPKADYLARISFHAGNYDDPAAFEALDAKLKAYEDGKPGNRLYFLSVPPTVFGAVCKMIGDKSRAVEGGFTHLIIEKPFGRDTETFNELNATTAALFKESALYRIDHYLGKEVVLNLMTLRFANQIFEPIWNNKHIHSVEITFKEDLGTGGRGGYFDGFGIIRDIMQNHLLQVFMLFGMEPPDTFDAEGIVKAKVDLLKATETLHVNDGVFLGQFTGNSWTTCSENKCEEHHEPGYLDDETVPNGSKCPTFAAVILKVDNARWKGVPFLMKAGKGLDERMSEVRVRFKTVPYNGLMSETPKGNELILRIQPDEALYLKTFSKEPGLEQVVKPSVMDMRYATQFAGAYVGDAYERMFLNAAKGDGSLFVSASELVEAWRVFTPLLHEIDEKKPDPVIYKFGSRNPPGFDEWSLKQANISQTYDFQEYLSANAKSVEELTKLFHRLDKDKSGSLDHGEMYQLAKEFYDGREPTQKKVSQIISMIDADGNGQITLDELIQSASKFANAFGTRASIQDHSDWDRKLEKRCSADGGWYSFDDFEKFWGEKDAEYYWNACAPKKK